MRYLTALLVAAGAVTAMAGTATAAPAGDVGALDDTRPPGCSSHFKDPNPRQRTVNTDAVMHEMSNPPVCSPHGPYLGVLSKGSTFIVYYADPVRAPVVLRLLVADRPHRLHPLPGLRLGGSRHEQDQGSGRRHADDRGPGPRADRHRVRGAVQRHVHPLRDQPLRERGVLP